MYLDQSEVFFINIIFLFIFLFTIYFVIKKAVKHGINSSMLFTDEQRDQHHELAVKKANEKWNNNKS